jgi:O-antigen ligase
MPEHLRALVVILALASVVFLFAKAPACAVAMRAADFERRRNLWFAITLAAFLAHNFWVFIIAAAALLLLALPREPNKLAMFFFLLFAVPAIPEEIAGVGGIRHFFTIHYIRLLALAVLLPAFIGLRRQPDTEPFGRTLPDKLIAGYIILNFLLMLTASTFTNTLRHGLFYAFTDVFLPYYVASRSLRNLQAFRDALMGYAVAALVLSVVAAFEFARHWLLYTSLENALGVQWNFGYYLERGEKILRAQGTTGQPIPLGYVMAVGAAFFLYLRRAVLSPVAWGLGLLLLLAGLIAPLSRGPWIGAVVILLLFIATDRHAGLRFAILGMLGLIILPALLLTGAGETIVDHLPFVGTIEAHNVTYRQRLLEVCVQVILQNPFFGAYGYIYSPAIQELRTGQGIIDIVNSYLGVGLSSGLIGLSLYAGFFIAVASSIFSAMRNLPDKNDERHLLGRVLFSTLLGIMVMIFTVSSITVIPVIYWCVAGLGVAYARMLAVTKVAESADRANFQPTSLRPSV